MGADAIAQELRTEIGGVLAKWLAEGAEKLFDLEAGGGKHGADETGRRDVVRGGFGGERRGGEGAKIEAAVDSGEAAGSGAAEQAEENGLGLIVAGVGGGDGVETMGGGGAVEKLVAGAAAGGFER